ncbi:MAG: hypothetical protein R3B41_03890 [Candidatus Doudnabacteria bacterium]
MNILYLSTPATVKKWEEIRESWDLTKHTLKIAHFERSRAAQEIKKRIRDINYHTGVIDVVIVNFYLNTGMNLSLAEFLSKKLGSQIKFLAVKASQPKTEENILFSPSFEEDPILDLIEKAFEETLEERLEAFLQEIGIEI